MPHPRQSLSQWTMMEETPFDCKGLRRMNTRLLFTRKLRHSEHYQIIWRYHDGYHINRRPSGTPLSGMTPLPPRRHRRYH